MGKDKRNNVSTLIVLGSGNEMFGNRTGLTIPFLPSAGGHTTEMLRLLSGTDRQLYRPRHYVIASTDDISARKMKEFEENVSQQ
jgi:hypothetical protein